ncbi:unnamed protein product [Paramecium sonneborni]|uniref:Uncharacterized protein n=1 Tax=Paramecium sonneborni TaxID=65129 RepID=A0A8S1NDC5_9CILI|nr:unnamed protein product [Paramecium sonneborni]
MGCSVTKTQEEKNLKASKKDKFEQHLITQSHIQSPPRLPQSKQFSIEKNAIIIRRRLKSQLKTRTRSEFDKQAFSA